MALVQGGGSSASVKPKPNELQRDRGLEHHDTGGITAETAAQPDIIADAMPPTVATTAG